jgi:hypothetical protein
VQVALHITGHHQARGHLLQFQVAVHRSKGLRVFPWCPV